MLAIFKCLPGDGANILVRAALRFGWAAVIPRRLRTHTRIRLNFASTNDQLAVYGASNNVRWLQRV